MNPASQPYNDGPERAHPCTAGDDSRSVPGTHEAPVSSDALRPIVRYHGGKWMLAPWIIDHLPAHHTYTEAFGGAASVLLRKHRSHAEVYNDLDGEVVNVFRVARERGAELRRALELTPFSREEFDLSYQPTDEPLEWARRTIVRAFQGFSSDAACGERSGFRSTSSRSGTSPAMDWRNYPDALTAITARLQGVVIENRDAKTVIAHHDRPTALHYVDPPYVHSTRSTKVKHTDPRKSYKYELADEEHVELAEFLHGLAGMVVLSGYPSPLYDHLFRDWRRIDRPALADGARPRVECLWLNPAADQARRLPQQKQLITGGAA
ncbi:DNA adenine methylase [Pseudoxanthomonas sp. LjRoot143]|uniref:DNA adenine methylase n=1 Tax=Pseudoxanthomonas sp. LjRoot143 TaxID=3342266 RepID=UPI003ECC85E8